MKTTARIVLFSLAAFAGAAQAGVYADDLSRCLVERTSREDRISLVRWMFAAAAAHPAVSAVAKVSPEQLDDANKAAGGLFMKLLTVSCGEEAKKALTYEGPATMQMSFQVLGQVAARDLFSSPEVTKAMSGLDKYLDKRKLEELGKQ